MRKIQQPAVIFGDSHDQLDIPLDGQNQSNQKCGPRNSLDKFIANFLLTSE